VDCAIKGDKFRLRDGSVYTYTGIRAGTGSLETVDESGDTGLFIRPNGETPGLGDYGEVVEIIPAPRVSIKEAKVGDVFRLRCGVEFVCTAVNGDARGYHMAKGTPADGKVSIGLNFGCDGHCPAWGAGYDVVELIPAPTPPLPDRVFNQVSKMDLDAIEKVVICSGDYSLEFEAVKRRICVLGRIDLRHSEKVKPGCFRVYFR
jgi:hypothetical protein